MSRPQDTWRAEYDTDTGEHRIYDGENTLIACVGNASWPFAFQERMAQAIADRGAEIRAAVEASS